MMQGAREKLRTAIPNEIPVECKMTCNFITDMKELGLSCWTGLAVQGSGYAVPMHRRRDIGKLNFAGNDFALPPFMEICFKIDYWIPTEQ